MTTVVLSVPAHHCRVRMALIMWLAPNVPIGGWDSLVRERTARMFTVDNGEAFTTTLAELVEANQDDLDWINEDGSVGDAFRAVLQLEVGDSIELGAPGSPGGSFIVARVS